MSHSGGRAGTTIDPGPRFARAAFVGSPVRSSAGQASAPQRRRRSVRYLDVSSRGPFFFSLLELPNLQCGSHFASRQTRVKAYRCAAMLHPGVPRSPLHHYMGATFHLIMGMGAIMGATVVACCCGGTLEGRVSRGTDRLRCDTAAQAAPGGTFKCPGPVVDRVLQRVVEVAALGAGPVDCRLAVVGPGFLGHRVLCVE